MTGNEFQLICSRTLNNNLTTAETFWWGLFMLFAESGEVSDILQHAYQHKDDPDWIVTLDESDYEHLKRELGDVMHSIAVICISCGWQMDDVMKQHEEKLRGRYPNGYCLFDDLHRKDDDL